MDFEVYNLFGVVFWVILGYCLDSIWTCLGVKVGVFGCLGVFAMLFKDFGVFVVFVDDKG
jgi:hypothetical protein